MKTLLSFLIVSVMVFATALNAADTKKKNTKPAANATPAQLLAKFDEDKDGKLDKTELTKLLKSLKENSITTKNDSWKKFDKNGDGKLDLAELTDLLKNNK